jgi:hypothetical protein
MAHFSAEIILECLVSSIIMAVITALLSHGSHAEGTSSISIPSISHESLSSRPILGARVKFVILSVKRISFTPLAKEVRTQENNKSGDNKANNCESAGYSPFVLQETDGFSCSGVCRSGAVGAERIVL